MTDPNRSQLIQTVQALGDLSNELIFLGGSVVGLLVTDDGSEPARATADVDAIVQVASRLEYHKVSKRLQAKGFGSDPNGPICRYIHGALVIDVMPLSEEILGFSNRWYSTAMLQYTRFELTDTLQINVVTAPVFIATKLEAFRARGANDPIMSHDLEDILMVLDGRRELLEDMQAAPLEVSRFIAIEFAGLLVRPFFADLIAGTFEPNRGAIVRDRMSEITGYWLG